MWLARSNQQLKLPSFAENRAQNQQWENLAKEQAVWDNVASPKTECFSLKLFACEIFAPCTKYVGEIKFLFGE